MHQFAELADRSVHITLTALNDREKGIVEALQTSSATTLVKNLQAIQLGRAITAVGMFSLFDSILQDRLQCKDGFEGARKYLEQPYEKKLLMRFNFDWPLTC